MIYPPLIKQQKAKPILPHSSIVKLRRVCGPESVTQPIGWLGTD